MLESVWSSILMLVQHRMNINICMLTNAEAGSKHNDSQEISFSKHAKHVSTNYLHEQT